MVGLLTFIITYLVDKFLCKKIFINFFIVLRYYKLPPSGDLELASWVRTIMGLAIFFHLVVSFMMISNNSMFSSVLSFSSFSEYQQKLSALPLKIPFIDIIFDSKRFEYRHSVLLFVAMITMLVIIILLTLLGKLIYSLINLCRKKCKCNCLFKCRYSCAICCYRVWCCIKDKCKFQSILNYFFIIFL